MILPEDRPDSPSKLGHQDQQQQAQETAQEPSPPPPAYEASSSSRPVDAESQTLYIPLQIKRGEAAGPRFCKAFCVAVIIYLLLAALTGSIAEVGRNVHWPTRVSLPSPTVSLLRLTIPLAVGVGGYRNGAAQTERRQSS